MNARTVLGSLLIVGLLAVPLLAGPPQTDNANIAKRLVTECTRIQEGDLVWVGGHEKNRDLLELVAVEVRKQGAFPLLITKSDDMIRRMFEDVPAKYDAQSPEFVLKIADMIDAAIIVESEPDPAFLVNVPPERIAAHRKAFQPVSQLVLKRSVRFVNLGNGIYPTPATARQFDMTTNELERVFWKGVNVDYLKLQTVTDVIKTRLNRGMALRITHDNGTDLKLRIERRPIYVNDGVISTDDTLLGGFACQALLPAGEVFITPTPGTAEGTVVFDRFFFRGQEIRDLKLTFRRGKLTEMTARSGLEPLKKLYTASGKGKDAFGAVGIGVNPNVKVPIDSRMKASMASGAVTLGFGSNVWLGGENRSDFALYDVLNGATLTIDDGELVDRGTLKP